MAKKGGNKKKYVHLHRKCAQIQNKSSASERTSPLLDTKGDGESCGHDSYDDGREGTNGTQHVLGSSTVVATVAAGGARRFRASRGAAEGAGAGSSATRGSGGIWVGRTKGLDFERLRASIDVAVVKNVRQLNSVSGGSGKTELLGSDEFTAHIVRECWNDGEGSGQHVYVGVRDDYVELIMSLVTTIPD